MSTKLRGTSSDAGIAREQGAAYGYTRKLGYHPLLATRADTGKGTKRERRVRLVVRRTRLTGRPQREIWPDWRHHAFITDLATPTVEADQFHRDHATVELAIRDLEEGAGLEHCPSGKFFANGAWLGCAVLAHNLTRWTARLGNLHPTNQLTVTRTIRTRHFALPGRLVNCSGKLRLPEHWPRPNTHHHSRQTRYSQPKNIDRWIEG